MHVSLIINKNKAFNAAYINKFKPVSAIKILGW